MLLFSYEGRRKTYQILFVISSIYGKILLPHALDIRVRPWGFTQNSSNSIIWNNVKNFIKNS